MASQVWYKKKEMEQRLKEKLILDAKIEKAQNIIEEQQNKYESEAKNQRKVKKWIKKKNRELRDKKYSDKYAKREKLMKKQHARNVNERVFKDWLKKSMLKQKVEIEVKKEEKQKVKQDKQKKKRHEMELAIKSDICFKEWLKKKKVQKREDRMRDKIKAHIEADDERKRVESKKQGEVLLAYSLTKYMHTLKKRPVSAKLNRPRY